MPDLRDEQPHTDTWGWYGEPMAWDPDVGRYEPVGPVAEGWHELVDGTGRVVGVVAPYGRLDLGVETGPEPGPCLSCGADVPTCRYLRDVAGMSGCCGPCAVDENDTHTPPASAANAWALSWPSGASEPVWAPELPEITPRPAQPR